MDPDSDAALDPALFVSDLQEANKNNFFCLFLFKGTLRHFSKIKVIKKSENSRNQGFLNFLLVDGRIRIQNKEA
jgi:hypothetical protein